MPNIGNFRVTQEDYDRIKDFAAKSGRPLSDIMREAVLQYIDKERAREDDAYFVARMRERDKIISDSLKSIENRFGLLLVRLGIDLESLYMLGWSLTANQPNRKKLFEDCYDQGVKRFRRKLKGLERDMIDSLIHNDDLQARPLKGSKTVADDDEEDQQD
jgi:predicted DNA-binding protein